MCVRSASITLGIILISPSMSIMYIATRTASISLYDHNSCPSIKIKKDTGVEQTTSFHIEFHIVQ